MKTNNRDIIIGSGAVILAALLWSLDGVFIRPKLYALDAGMVVLIEHALGFVLLSPFFFLNWKKIKALGRKDWLAVLWVCFFGGALGTIMITKAFFAAMGGLVTFATVVILQKLQPVFALLMARLVLGEKLSRKFYLWAAAAVGAAYLLAFGKSGLDPRGIDLFHSAAWFAFLAAFAFGSSTVLGKRALNHLNFAATAALRFGITSILMLAYVLLAGAGFDFGQITLLQWQLFAVIVFTSGAVAMFIYYYGLKRIPASVATICELAWPISAVVLDYFLNGNTLNSVQLFAASVMMAAFYGVVREGSVKGIIFRAKVIRGSGRGRLLGFPTANLNVEGVDLAYGVYKAEAEINGQKYSGLLFFGFKETFGEKPSLEILLKGLAHDIYGEDLTVRVGQKIRDIKKFSGPDELKSQIARDIEENL